MTLHEAAQSVAWFAISVLVGVAVVLWRDYRKETKDIPRPTRIVQPRRVK